MTSPRRFRRAFAILIALAATAGPAHADEGFWPVTAIPRDKIRAAYGVDLNETWVNHLQHSVVRFPGGSGVFVSPEGLVLTNHHVALYTLTALSTSARNLVADGFLARTRSQELRAPDLELLVLDRVEDVTTRVNAAVKPGQSAGDAYLAQRVLRCTHERFAFCRVATETARLAQWPHGGEAAQLRKRIAPGADQRSARRVVSREMARRDGRGGARLPQRQRLAAQHALHASRLAGEDGEPHVHLAGTEVRRVERCAHETRASHVRGRQLERARAGHGRFAIRGEDRPRQQTDRTVAVLAERRFHRVDAMAWRNRGALEQSSDIRRAEEQRHDQSGQLSSRSTGSP